MNISFTFKHLEPTEAIKNHATQKFEKVLRLVPGAFDIHFIFEVIKTEHRAELTFKSDLGRFVSHFSSDNLYASIDTAIDRIMHQVTKEKGKQSSQKTGVS